MNDRRGMVKVLLAGGLTLLCGIIGLVSLGAGSTVSLVDFGNVPSHKDRVQVYGELDKTSIRSIDGAKLVAFDLVEEKSGERLPVLYQNPAAPLPGNFPAASHARVTGQYDPSAKRFVGDQVAVKCPSKYQEKGLSLETKSAVDKWQSATGLKAQGT